MKEQSGASRQRVCPGPAWVGRSRGLGLIGLTLVSLVTLVPGCKTGGSGVRPAIAVVSPDWPTLNVRTLAYLGVGSSVGDEPARISAEELVEQALVGSQSRLTVLTYAQAYSKASAGGAGETFDRAMRSWRDRRLIDQFAVQELCRQIGVDGLILGDLSDWKRERLDFTEQGSSFTQIALKLSIFSGQTGLEAWNAYQMKRRDSAEYTPGISGSGTYTDEGGVSRTQRASSVTPEPPRAEHVLAEVLESIFASFPPRGATP